MGNSCFINTKNCLQKHFDICVDKNISDIKVEESLMNISKSDNQINKLKNYFIQGEKEISEDFNQKNIGISAKKKRNSGFVNLLLIDKNKYENMLKKLLEQKSIERKGPKRRETIRKGDKINILVKEVMNDKNSNRNNKYKKALSKKCNSIIISNKDKSKIRQTTTLNRKDSLFSKSMNRIIKSKMKKAITLNEILTDGNHSTVFNKKDTNKV